MPQGLRNHHEFSFLIEHVFLGLEHELDLKPSPFPRSIFKSYLISMENGSRHGGRQRLQAKLKLKAKEKILDIPTTINNCRFSSPKILKKLKQIGPNRR